MNCVKARPLLLAGDPAAEAHLEGCVACAAWLEKSDPLVERFRAARPEAMPAPDALRRRVLRRWAPARRGLERWGFGAALAAATLLLVFAAGYALATWESGPLATATGYAQPVFAVLAGPRELLIGNLVGLGGLAGLALLSFAIGGLLYRDLGRTPRGLTQ